MVFPSRQLRQLLIDPSIFFPVQTVLCRCGQLTLSWDNSSSWLWSRKISYTIQLEYKVAPAIPILRDGLETSSTVGRDFDFSGEALEHDNSESEGDFSVGSSPISTYVDHQVAAEEPPRPADVPESYVYVVRDNGTAYYMDPHNMNNKVEIVNAVNTGELDFESGGQGGGPLSPMTPLVHDEPRTPSPHSGGQDRPSKIRGDSPTTQPQPQADDAGTESSHVSTRSSLTPTPLSSPAKLSARQELAARKLQAQARGRAARAVLSQQRHAATLLQAGMRGRAARDYFRRQKGERYRWETKLQEARAEELTSRERNEQDELTDVHMDVAHGQRSASSRTTSSASSPATHSAPTIDAHNAAEAGVLPQYDGDSAGEDASTKQSIAMGEVPDKVTQPTQPGVQTSDQFLWGGAKSFRQAAKTVKLQSRGTAQLAHGDVDLAQSKSPESSASTTTESRQDTPVDEFDPRADQTGSLVATAARKQTGIEEDTLPLHQAGDVDVIPTAATLFRHDGLAVESPAEAVLRGVFDWSKHGGADDDDDEECGYYDQSVPTHESDELEQQPAAAFDQEISAEEQGLAQVATVDEFNSSVVESDGGEEGHYAAEDSAGSTAVDGGSDPDDPDAPYQEDFYDVEHTDSEAVCDTVDKILELANADEDAGFSALDADGDGSISKAELSSAMQRLGANPSDEEVSAMVSAVDVDGDGAIDRDEFKASVVAGDVAGTAGEAETETTEDEKEDEDEDEDDDNLEEEERSAEESAGASGGVSDADGFKQEDVYDVEHTDSEAVCDTVDKILELANADEDAGFSALDADGNGSISKEELSSAMQRLGANPSDEEVSAMVSAVDVDGDGAIDRDEFKASVVAGDVAGTAGEAETETTEDEKEDEDEDEDDDNVEEEERSAGDSASAGGGASDTDGFKQEDVYDVEHTDSEAVCDTVDKILELANADEDAGFSALDADGDGSISKAELSSAMQRLGANPSDEEVSAMVSAVDVDGDGAIDRDEFKASVVAGDVAGTAGEAETETTEDEKEDEDEDEDDDNVEEEERSAEESAGASGGVSDADGFKQEDVYDVEHTDSEAVCDTVDKILELANADEDAGFSSLDADGDGSISKEELSSAMQRLGANPSDEEVSAMVSAVDVDGDGAIDRDEFKASVVAGDVAGTAGEAETETTEDEKEDEDEDEDDDNVEEEERSAGDSASAGGGASDTDGFKQEDVYDVEHTDSEAVCDTVDKILELANADEDAGFSALDADGNGSISKEELSSAMQRLGANPSDEEVSAMVSAVDVDGDGAIDRDEFKLSLTAVQRTSSTTSSASSRSNSCVAELVAEVVSLVDYDDGHEPSTARSRGSGATPSHTSSACVRTPRGGYDAPAASTHSIDNSRQSPELEDRVLMSESLRNIERLLRRIESVLTPSPQRHQSSTRNDSATRTAFPRAQLFGEDDGPPQSIASHLGERLYELYLAGDSSCDVVLEPLGATGASAQGIHVHSVAILSACPVLYRKCIKPAARAQGTSVPAVRAVVPGAVDVVVLRMLCQILYTGALDMQTTTHRPPASAGRTIVIDEDHVALKLVQLGLLSLLYELNEVADSCEAALSGHLSPMGIGVLLQWLEKEGTSTHGLRWLEGCVLPRVSAAVLASGGDSNFAKALTIETCLQVLPLFVDDALGASGPLGSTTLPKHPNPAARDAPPDFANQLHATRTDYAQALLQFLRQGGASPASSSQLTKTSGLGIALRDQALSALCSRSRLHAEFLEHHCPSPTTVLLLLLFGDSCVPYLLYKDSETADSDLIASLSWYWDSGDLVTTSQPEPIAATTLYRAVSRCLQFLETANLHSDGGAGENSRRSNSTTIDWTGFVQNLTTALQLSNSSGTGSFIWKQQSVSLANILETALLALGLVSLWQIPTELRHALVLLEKAHELSQTEDEVERAGADEAISVLSPQRQRHPVPRAVSASQLFAATAAPARVAADLFNSSDALALPSSVGAATEINAAFDSNSSGRTPGCESTSDGGQFVQPVPAPRPCVVVVGGFSGRRLDVAEAFDPAIGTWTVLPRMLSLRTGCCAAAADGVGGECGLVVAGGYSGGDFDLDSCEAFVGSSRDQWAPLPPMSERRRSAAAASWRGCVVVVGGSTDHGRPMQSCEMYVPISGRWVPLPPLHRARSGCVAVSAKLQLVGADGRATMEECVVVLGGVNSAGEFIAEIEILRCIDDGHGGESMQWDVLGSMPVPRSHFAAVAVPASSTKQMQREGADVEGDQLLIIGGSCAKQQFLRSVVLWDPNGSFVDHGGGERCPVGTWKEMPPLRVPRAACSAVVLHGAVFVCGGWPKYGYSLKSVETLSMLAVGSASCSDKNDGAAKPESQRWEFAPPMTVARGGCAAAVVTLPV